MEASRRPGIGPKLLEVINKPVQLFGTTFSAGRLIHLTTRVALGALAFTISPFLFSTFVLLGVTVGIAYKFSFPERPSHNVYNRSLGSLNAAHESEDDSSHTRSARSVREEKSCKMAGSCPIGVVQFLTDENVSPTVEKVLVAAFLGCGLLNLRYWGPLTGSVLGFDVGAKAYVNSAAIRRSLMDARQWLAEHRQQPAAETRSAFSAIATDETGAAGESSSPLSQAVNADGAFLAS